MDNSANEYFKNIARGYQNHSKKDLNDALKWACHKGNLTIVEDLLKKGADVNYLDEFGGSVLHFAIKGENPQVILKLLEHEVDYTMWQQDGETLLLLACRCQYLNVVRYLIQLQPDSIHSDVDSVGRKALHIACLCESYSVVELLINQPNSDVNQLDENGWTGLHYVCSTKSQCQCNLMHLLLTHNADPLIEAPNGKTALEMAFECGIIKHIIDILPVTRIMEILIKFDNVKGRISAASAVGEQSFHKSHSNISHLNDGIQAECNSTEETILLYWKKIINNEDLELFDNFLEKGLWLIAVDEKNYRKSLSMESRMKSLFEECYENGLGIHTYIRVHFEEEIKRDDFKSILLELSGLENFSSLNYESCLLFDNFGESSVLLALLCGRLNLVKYLLISRQFDIIPLGLIIILICQTLEKDSNFPKQVKTKLQCFSDTTESIVVDALNNTFLIDNSNGKTASLNILDLRLRAFGNLSILDLADKAQCNRVLSLACCQVVVDKLWYGRLAFMSFRWRLFATIMPLLILPYQICVSDKKLIAEDVFISDRKRRLTYHTLQRISVDTHNRSYGRCNGLFQIVHLLKSPAIIFYYHSLMQFAFLMLFSYVMIYDFHFKITLLEYICYAYIIGYALEEISQCIQVSRYHSIGRYFGDARNRLDVVFLMFMQAGVMTRLFCINKNYVDKKQEAQDHLLYIARVILLTGLLVFYFRALFVLSIYKILGPKLKMIYSMIQNDLIPFMALFILFLVSFGVVFEGLQNPNNLRYDSIFESIKEIYSTGFYGMFSPDYTTELVRDCAINSSTCTHQLGSQLVFYFYNIVYIMVVDIMLINLLIALFSNTVARIDQESTTNWFADRYKMVEEYTGRSILPPPFNMLCILIQLLLLFCKSLCKATRNASSFGREKVVVVFFIMQAFALKGKRNELGRETTESIVHRGDHHSSHTHSSSTDNVAVKLTELQDKVDQLCQMMSENSDFMRRPRTICPINKPRNWGANRLSLRKKSSTFVTQMSVPIFLNPTDNAADIPLNEIDGENAM